MIGNGITQAWHNCYNEPWQNITPEAFTHPAKFSSALIRRIYQTAIERGWLKAGDTVIDCFAGTGLGSRDATANGINWIGCELERRFTDIGSGVKCTGISKADWVRFYGRWERANYKDGRRWCPRCLAEARQISPVSLGFTLSLFGDDVQSAAYTRNSGIVPETMPHYYQGNLDLFRKYAKGGAWAVLLQGDSRNLVEIARGQMDGAISSPPYTNSMESWDKKAHIDWSKTFDGKDHRGNGHGSQGTRSESYGSTPGQLSTLKEGNLSAAISSPPFAGNSGGRGEASRNGIDAALFERHSGGMVGGTGDDPDNLAHLPVRGFEAAISSPPYLHPAKTGETREDSWSDGRSRPVGVSQRNNNGYGSTSGQLGAMPAGEVDTLPWPHYRDEWRPAASISSPPFEDQIPSQASPEFHQKRASIGKNNSLGRGDYGTTPGQLGQESKETFWAAAKTIIEQVFCLLKPGGVTIWVTKRFVRDGEIVEFSQQWIQLCEAVGFEFLEGFQAMLVKENGQQATIDGGLVNLRTEKKSFFRRLSEKRGSPRIDWEDVLVLRKPTNGKI